MRLGADGTLYVGQPEPYLFSTREWAQLCVKRLKSLDAAFGRVPVYMALSTTGNFGIGVKSPALKFKTEFRTMGETLVAMDQNNVITQLNIPAMIGIWWRGTNAHRLLHALMWGERGKL